MAGPTSRRMLPNGPICPAYKRLVAQRRIRPWTIERPLDGTPTPMPTVLRRLGTQTRAGIAREITAIRQRPVTLRGRGSPPALLDTLDIE